MATAKIDENGRATMTALLNTDGRTVTNVCADPTDHSLCVDDNTTGSNNGGTYVRPDENTKQFAAAPGLFALSSAGDGALVALYVDSNGKLLVDSS